MTSGCCICVTVAVDIPTHTSMKVQILYPALGIQIRASQGSLDTRDLHVFARSNLNQLRYFYYLQFYILRHFQQIISLHTYMSTRESYILFYHF